MLLSDQLFGSLQLAPSAPCQLWRSWLTLTLPTLAVSNSLFAALFNWLWIKSAVLPVSGPGSEGACQLLMNSSTPPVKRSVTGVLFDGEVSCVIERS